MTQIIEQINDWVIKNASDLDPIQRVYIKIKIYRMIVDNLPEDQIIKQLEDITNAVRLQIDS